MTELNAAIKSSSKSCAGLDDISYKFIKELAQMHKEDILKLYNQIWSLYPQKWKEAVIIPVPKPGKDHTLPENYRPTKYYAGRNTYKI